MKLSIVTVTYNAQDGIEDTIRSIREQTYPDIELIVIDGGSTDGTLKILDKYRTEIDCLVSEPDQGMCDAMNKGSRKASGDWINFLHAGDTFVSPNVVEEAFAHIPSDIDYIYGDCQIVYQTFKKIMKAPTDFRDLPNAMLINHQSMFIKADLVRKYPFDLDNALAADYDQLVRLVLAGKKSHYSGTLVANYADGGNSAINKVQYLKQLLAISQKSFPNQFGRDVYLRSVISYTACVDILRMILPTSAFEGLMRMKGVFRPSIS